MAHSTRRQLVLSLALSLTLILVAGASSAATEGDEIPFSVAQVFFELNDTDGDLGIHALIDGDPWKRLSIESPDEREILEIRLKSRLRRQGLTELFFESAEPTFDELAPQRFFRRFPEGEYEVEGVTLEGEELESVAIITHLVPSPVANLAVNGTLVPDDCDDGPPAIVSAPVLVTWDPVTLSHPDLGRTNEPISVNRYQVVIEREDPPYTMTADLASDATSFSLPTGIINPGDEIKIEVLVREESWNQTGTESCFELAD